MCALLVQLLVGNQKHLNMSGQCKECKGAFLEGWEESAEPSAQQQVPAFCFSLLYFCGNEDGCAIPVEAIPPSTCTDVDHV